MSDIFACRECHAIYTITRLREPPAAPASCEVCGSNFPPIELGEWLAYQHAEPEWNVKAWLTRAPEVEAHSSRDDQPRNFDQAVEVEDQPAATGTKVLTTLTGGVRKIAASIARA